MGEVDLDSVTALANVLYRGELLCYPELDRVASRFYHDVEIRGSLLRQHQ